MIPDWQTNAVYFSSLLRCSRPTLWARLTQILDRERVGCRLLHRTKDVWTRDYMPIQVDEATFVKFDYHPDYLRGFGHLITDERACQEVPFLRNCERSHVRLDGGNAVASSRRIILTDKVFRENPSWPKNKLERAIARLLHVEECIFIPTEAGDWIGHSDGVVRFLGEDRVVMNDYTVLDANYRSRLLRVFRRHRLDIEFLPYFVEGMPVKGPIGSAVGNYVNFLRVGDLVVMPMYEAPQDDVALRRMESFLPDACIVPVPCVELAQEGGVLNCIGWSVRKPTAADQKHQKSGSAD